jgi:pimeloyl-ACP methyl ester carboxylesterase
MIVPSGASTSTSSSAIAVAVAALGLMLASGTVSAARDIEVAGPQGPLRGTLSGERPSGSEAGSAPVVLMIQGSGPSDRDGNQLPSIKAAPLRLLAEALAERGIVSARADKRGLHGSREATADPEAVTLGDYASDARNWIGFLREATGARCVFLLGHSEGGLVALKTATEAPEGICGLILAATPGRPLGEILRQQFAQALPPGPLREPTLAAVERIVTTLEAGEPADVSGVDPQLAAIFRPSVQPFLIDLLAQDPARLAADTDLPLLILQGTTDLQVTLADASTLAAARPDARLVLLDGVNHMFKTAPAERAANIAAYARDDLPLADGAVDAVLEFLRAPDRAALSPSGPATESLTR